MIRAILLNSQASLNNYIQLENIAYVPGERIIIVVKVIDSQLDIRFIPPTTATMNMKFLQTDGNELIKSATKLDPADRSMWTVTLSTAETLLLASSNIQIDLDILNDTTDIQKTVIQNGLSKTLLTGEC